MVILWLLHEVPAKPRAIFKIRKCTENTGTTKAKSSTGCEQDARNAEQKYCDIVLAKIKRLHQNMQVQDAHSSDRQEAKSEKRAVEPLRRILISILFTSMLQKEPRARMKAADLIEQGMASLDDTLDSSLTDTLSNQEAIREDLWLQELLLKRQSAIDQETELAHTEHGSGKQPSAVAASPEEAAAGKEKAQEANADISQELTMRPSPLEADDAAPASEPSRECQVTQIEGKGAPQVRARPHKGDSFQPLEPACKRPKLSRPSSW